MDTMTRKSENKRVMIGDLGEREVIGIAMTRVGVMGGGMRRGVEGGLIPPCHWGKG